MLQKVVEFRRTEADLDVSVARLRGEHEAWTVEAIETDGDGRIFQAVFSGPDARSRAEEYAAFKYGR